MGRQAEALCPGRENSQLNYHWQDQQTNKPTNSHCKH
jgi:hypothetical protein